MKRMISCLLEAGFETINRPVLTHFYLGVSLDNLTGAYESRCCQTSRACTLWATRPDQLHRLQGARNVEQLTGGGIRVQQVAPRGGRPLNSWCDERAIPHASRVPSMCSRTACCCTTASPVAAIPLALVTKGTPTSCRQAAAPHIAMLCKALPEQKHFRLRSFVLHGPVL